MSVTDSDFELIESHLDGELSSALDEALRDRMGSEPELASALETARAERDARLAVFAAMEPDGGAVERVNRHASREVLRINREEFWKRTSHRLRIVSAAAACLVIGFSVGRIVDSGVLNLQPRTPSATAQDPASKAIEVALTDEHGHELGVQRFTSEERAREFVNDLDRWHQRQRELNEPRVIRTVNEDQF